MSPWAGTILHVDLPSGKVWKDLLHDDLKMRFIGGRGVNAKLLWDLIKPRIDPLSPENVLIFGTGALTCTTAPASGRATVTCKSPQTNLYLKSSVGGAFGAELKFAGYDHLVVHGRADEPTLLNIEDSKVALLDANHIWGKGVRVTNEVLRRKLGSEVKVAAIGPAGENMVKFAAIMASVYHAAARGGTGAVMGSKKLKAIAVRGTGSIRIHDPEGFWKKALALRKAFLDDYWGQKYFLYGTGGFYSGPAYNFLRDAPPSGEQISAPYLIKKGYLKRHIGCFSCTNSCHRYTEIETGPYAGTYTCGPEYETFSALGAGAGIADPEVVIKANDLCNILGLDTISTGVVVEWAMESYEKGLLTKGETEGLDLRFGNDQALLKVIQMIATRKGYLGNLLAEGVKRASEKIGKDSWKWAMCNSKGLEHSRVDTRMNKSYALAFAVNPRGPDHLHTECIAARGTTGRMRDVVEEMTGKKWPEAQTQYPEIVRWHEDTYAAAETLGFCAFTCTSAQAVLPKDMAELFSLATGIRMSGEEISLIGRRIITVERCFNVREGATRELDDLPWRMMNEPVSWGLFEGMVSSREWLDEMLDKYCALHGWDSQTSWPYRETLELLGLDEIAQELEHHKKLPPRRTG